MKQNTCMTCGKLITEVRAGRKKFCSDACRALSWRTGRIATPCYYCGCPATTIDHVPPRSVRASLLSYGLQDRYPFRELNACKECNSLLGSRVALWAPARRKVFVRRALRIRYHSLLTGRVWRTDELTQLGPTLRQFIEARQIERDVLLSRLSW